MAKNRGTELAKNTFIIAIGKFSTQIISFLLLPLYTSLLSKSDYGTVDLLNTIIQLVLPFATLMIEQGAFRYILTAYDDKDIKQIINSSFCVVILLNLGILVLGTISFFFYENDYMGILLMLIVSSSFVNWILQIARGLKKTALYSFSNFILAVINILCNVLFIYALRYGAIGMLLGSLLGNIACCIVAFIGTHIIKWIDIKEISKSIIKKLLKYSIPLIPNTLSLWLINSSDRAIVSMALGTDANGILAISHKFPTVITTVFSIFLISWHEMGTLHYHDADCSEFFSDVINKIFLAFGAACMMLIAFMPVIFPIMVNSNFNEAYNTIPIYLLSVLLNVMMGLLGVIYVAEERTKEISKSTIISGFVNILVHFSLINILGLYAAAISTLISYIVVLVYRVRDIKKYITIKYDIKKYIFVGVLFVIAIAVYYYNNICVSIITTSILFVVFVVANREMLYRALRLIKSNMKK